MQLAEPETSWPRRLLLYALCLAPLLAFAEIGWLHPRPLMALVVDDNEQSLFYNSKLLADCRPVSHVAHPDMPLHHLGRQIQRFTGSGMEAAVPFINTFLFLAALLTTLALALHVRLNLAQGPLGLGVAGLVLLMTGPSLWQYQHMLAAESLNLALALPAVALFASALSGASGLGIKLAVIGLLLGLGTANKLSFLTLAAALLPACCLLALGRSRRGQASWWSLAAAPLAFVLTFLAFCWSVLPEVMVVASATGLERSLTLDRWGWSLKVFFRVFPLYAWLVAALLPAALVMSVMALRRRRAPADDLGLELMAAWVFLVLGYAALCHTIGQSPTKHPESAHPLTMFRNTAPIVLVGPFALWLSGHLGGLLWPGWRTGWPRLAGAALVLVSLGGLVLDAGKYAAWRRGHLDQLASRATAIHDGLNQLVGAETPLVLWDDSPSRYYGLASFHLWGNYVFADNLYDHELARAFPRLRWLHLRNIKYLTHTPVPASGDYGFTLAAPYRYKKIDSYWDGDRDIQPPLAFIIKQDQFNNEFRGQGEGPFLELLRRRYPQLEAGRDVTHHSVGGVRWIIISIR